MDDIELSSDYPSSATEAIPRNRLPNLFEVLSRRTIAPIDLFSFYIYMRDQQRSVEYLDFWLDVAQHLSLCRFARSMRSSGLVDEAVTGPSATPVNGHDEVSSPAKDILPTGNITRANLQASAEKILYTYLLPGSEKEIVLPQAIVKEVLAGVEEQQRHDPEIFDDAKDYVFYAMERDAFPGFLQAKAFGNLTPVNVALRVVVGLVSLFGGLWAAFTLVFLNYSRLGRCWIILPFLVAVYCLVSHSYMLDPIVGIFGFSEYTFMRFVRIRDPFIRSLTVRRSTFAVGIILLSTLAGCAVFIFAPGPTRNK
ncbi:regulator of G protein signaling superfamily [Amniculicola lignicola CBS 123094]|uniref:Regulator of G protein signaling superfamily n=1 Tax=Amniculicola lignicola CBS 123094 TaxID=1392246 RepID=A0A6A5VXX7_9PLEO|nr:regulator of G protein signaling superfamily [Amniculicola lignicola CBS 123094]